MQRNESTLHARATEWLTLAGLVSECGCLLRAAVAEQVTDEPLTEADLWLLWTCHRAVGRTLSQRELALELGVSPAQVSSQVEQLRRRGLLLGQRDPEDRRRQQWQVTAMGEELLSRVLGRLEQWALRIEARLPRGSGRDEVQALVSALKAPAEQPSGTTAPSALRLPEPTAPKGAAA